MNHEPLETLHPALEQWGPFLPCNKYDIVCIIRIGLSGRASLFSRRHPRRICITTTYLHIQQRASVAKRSFTAAATNVNPEEDRHDSYDHHDPCFPFVITMYHRGVDHCFHDLGVCFFWGLHSLMKIMPGRTVRCKRPLRHFTGL